ncbi:phosphatase PAP2 family protein [Ensifer sp. HO-A22]|uniref:Phosphatase PAP2 family protein n=1 Tax=Ensifer oleiphilus TaxID=2742698 RepID=A0A7Y6QAQ6_9HYPH|nr:phosphatase PAP2 family protein [Ensifer oleiphilus]NVD42116.1 phosphatase PAP2 family protein [Ensifer oleiphilus]
MSSILQSITTPAAGHWWRVANPLTWPARLQAHICRHPVQTAASATIFAGFVFMAFPGIDLAVSRWAAAGNADFPLSREHALRLLRDFNRLIPILLLPALAVMLAGQMRRPRAWLPRPHKILFFLTFYALGPGLIIQLLKRLVGRARPSEIIEFGGTLPFTPAWQVSGACSRSCSFASGESATAIALIALAFFLPPAWRWKAVAALVPVVLVFSLNRIAFGAHFLSDVVLAWLLMLWIMLWLWSVFAAQGARIDAALTRDRRPIEA